MLRRIACGELQRHSRPQGIAQYLEGALDSGAHSGMALQGGLRAASKTQRWRHVNCGLRTCHNRDSR